MMGRPGKSKKNVRYYPRKNGMPVVKVAAVLVPVYNVKWMKEKCVKG